MYKLFLLTFLLLNQGIDHGIPTAGRQEGDVYFLTEPRNIITMEGMTVFIPCNFGNTDAAPSWNIVYKNGTAITASSSNLPPKHLYNGTGIIVQDIDADLHQTTYICYLIYATVQTDGRKTFKTLRSTPGTLNITETRTTTLLKIAIDMSKLMHH